MRSWLIVLLLFVFPLQWASGALGSYCSHETDPIASKHFGHHQHQHQASGEAPASADAPSDKPGALHPDCLNCHLACSIPMPPVAVDIGPSPDHQAHSDHRRVYRSHIPSGPERPDREELVAARDSVAAPGSAHF